ncbi:MAG: hypothetical protein M1825_005000 [Sarcosagium campestre]|nr:MAG: hypothetical protein M1825_005000 [Sarcosagium campestre]
MSADREGDESKELCSYNFSRFPYPQLFEEEYSRAEQSPGEEPEERQAHSKACILQRKLDHPVYEKRAKLPSSPWPTIKRERWTSTPKPTMFSTAKRSHHLFVCAAEYLAVINYQDRERRIGLLWNQINMRRAALNANDSVTSYQLHAASMDPVLQELEEKLNQQVAFIPTSKLRPGAIYLPEMNKMNGAPVNVNRK